LACASRRANWRTWSPPQAGEHLVYCTPFNRVIALDARNGRLCAGFGAGGEVTLAFDPERDLVFVPTGALTRREQHARAGM